MLVSPAERTHACTLPISPILLNASTCSYVWTGYQKNLDALATFDDVCAYGDSTQPQCAAAQALAPFRYIVSSTTAVRYCAGASWLAPALPPHSVCTRYCTRARPLQVLPAFVALCCLLGAAHSCALRGEVQHLHGRFMHWMSSSIHWKSSSIHWMNHPCTALHLSHLPAADHHRGAVPQALRHPGAFLQQGAARQSKVAAIAQTSTATTTSHGLPPASHMHACLASPVPSGKPGLEATCNMLRHSLAAALHPTAPHPTSSFTGHQVECQPMGPVWQGDCPQRRLQWHHPLRHPAADW